MIGLTATALAALLGWVYLLTARSRYWRAEERLTPAAKTSAGAAEPPAIVAIIPARNEAQTIASVLSAHLACTYRGDFHLILVNDQSADATGALAEETIARMAAGAGAGVTGGRTGEVIDGAQPPPGWSGKLWALEQGLAHADRVMPDARYILFTDADIMLAPSTLTVLVEKAEREDLALTSLMARLDARGWGALLIPAFIYFFQQLYPFARVKDPLDDTAAAAGGCMLVRRSALRAAGGVQAVKENLIDDCALARRIKDTGPGTKISLALADDEAVSLRDNRKLSAIWQMVVRTAYTQLRHSPILLAGTVIAMSLIYLAAPLIVLFSGWHGAGGAALVAIAAWGLMSYSYLPVLSLYERPLWEAPLLPVAAAFYLLMTLSSAMDHWRGAGAAWKGRRYRQAG